MSYMRRPRQALGLDFPSFPSTDAPPVVSDDALVHETLNPEDSASGAGMATSQVPPNPMPKGVVLSTLQACIAGGGSPQGCAATLQQQAATDKRAAMFRLGVLAGVGGLALLFFAPRPRR